MATSNAPVENASDMSYVTIAELTLSETIFALASILAGTILYGNQLLEFSRLLQNGKYAFIYAISYLRSRDAYRSILWNICYEVYWIKHTKVSLGVIFVQVCLS